MRHADALARAHHYQELAWRSPEDVHFWLARSLYYGRMARGRVTARSLSPAVNGRRDELFAQPDS